MSRRKKGFVPEEDEPELDISSLIDVCFLLLIYFMVTATIQPRESDLGLSLPAQSPPSSSSSRLEPMLITIQGDGSITVNKSDQMDAGASEDNKRELPLLKGRLEVYKSGAEAANSQPLVNVAVMEDANQQAVVDVLNCLVGLEIEQVTFTDLAN